jgi:hypothetical protein
MASTYLRDTRAPRYSLLFAVPLLVLYEFLARMLSGEEGVRNGADVLLKSLFILLGGRHGLTAFAVVLLGTGIVLVARDWRKSGPPRAGYFAVGRLRGAIRRDYEHADGSAAERAESARDRAGERAQLPD